MAQSVVPDGNTSIAVSVFTRGITKNGDIRHYGDNVPSVIAQTGIVPGNPTPGTKPNATEIPSLKLDNQFQPPSTQANGGDAFNAFATDGKANGNALQGGNTEGGGDSGNEGYDSYGKL